MKRLQAYKFELRPDGQQERQMRRFSGSCRFVFNKALALQKEGYEHRKTQAVFECVDCRFKENADVVGAINILRAGHVRLACEVSGATRPPAAGTHRSDSRVAPCHA